MTADFETILRADLARAAVDVPVDVEAVISGGRRGVRRRRLAWAGGALAIALLAGAIAVPVGLLRPPQDSASVFAPQRVGSVSFGMAQTWADRAPDARSDYSAIVVSITRTAPTAGRIDVIATLPDGSQTTASSGEADLTGVVGIALPYGYWIAVVPSSVGWWNYLEPPGSDWGGSLGEDRSLGTWTVRRYRNETFDASGQRRVAPIGYAWRTADGRYLSSTGAVLHVVALGAPEGQDHLDVVVDEGLETVYVVAKNSAGRWSLRDAQRHEGFLFGSGGPHSQVLMRLPADARDVTWTLAAGATDVKEYEAADPLLGRLVLIVGDSPGTELLATGCAWTDARGVRHEA